MATLHSVAHAELHFRARPLLLRFLVNGLSLLVTVAIVPHVFFGGDYPILSWVLISAVFGFLNAFLKPLLQIVMLPLIFVSYGLVVVLINTLMLWTLDWLFPERFFVQGILWALVGGLVCGLVEGLLQNLLDREAVVLPLPADERRAVIFEDELVAGHRGDRGFPCRSLFMASAMA